MNNPAKIDFQNWPYSGPYYGLIRSLRLVEKKTSCIISNCEDKHPPSNGAGPCPSQRCIERFARICYQIYSRETTLEKIREEMRPEEKILLDYMDKHITVCNKCLVEFKIISAKLRIN